jgi:HEAT repeat protein
MPKAFDIFNRLLAVSDDSVDDAMAAALPTADPQAAERLVATLLKRGRESGRFSLLQHFHRLPAAAQNAVCERATDFTKAIRDALERDPATFSPNVVEIIVRPRAFRLAYLLSEQTRLGSSETRAAAAAGLLELARAAAEPQEGEPRDVAAEAALLAAVEEAVAAYRHHNQPAVLVALAALSPRRMSESVRILHERSSHALEPMRRLLADAKHPEVRRSLLNWVRIPALSDAAITGIQHPPLGTFGDLFHHAHLLVMPAVVRGLRRLPEPERLLHDSDHETLPLAYRHALPRWILALPLEPKKRVDALGRLAKASGRPTRLAALRALMSLALHPEAAADEAIAAFSHDSDATLARIALRHLTRRRWPGLAKLLVQLMSSPHEQIRRLAGAHLAPLGFGRFWDAWPKLGFSERLAGGQALIKLDPHFHRHLGEKLARTERPVRLRALAMIHGLNQGFAFEVPLIALLRSNDDVIAASAARALGSAGSRAAVEALEIALRHPIARVRANAVESLAQLQATHHVDRLVEMAKDDENRPRANAIGALMSMRTDEALSSLVRMLHDQRPEQRASALWLVDHLGLIEVARHVAELSISDPDREIQGRASGVIQHLIESLRAGRTHEEAKGNKAG